MTSAFRIGLAGTGDIGRLHARAIRAQHGIELCVCQGVKPAGAEAFAREFSTAVYPSYAAMLADPSVDAVDICVPNDLHRAYTEEAAAAGKHVLCEKPIALTLEDARAMAAAARRAGVLLIIGHPLRFWPEYVKMREVLRSCALGTCRAITMRRMLSLLAGVEGEQRWRHKPERMGGAILDLAVHDLDFLNWTFGMPESVYCSGARSDDGGWNHTAAVFRYGAGPVALVESSFMLQGDPMVFTAKAVCDRGSLDYAMDLQQFAMHALAGGDGGGTAHDHSATLVCYRAGLEPELLLNQEPNVLDAVFARELAYFVECARGRRENELMLAEDAIAALRLALAAKQSAETGEVVRICQS
jgi:UDP-N-acetylglucosamine 3-dehydrogenase